jgi:hypothetical protein
VSSYYRAPGLEKHLKKKELLSSTDINQILINLISRRRFSYNWRDVFTYVLRCLCIRKTHTRDHHFLYQKGEKKLSKELDVISLLKSLRQIKLLTQVTLSQKQKFMLKFQRKNLIETSSSSCDSDSKHNDPMNLMESKNPLIKLAIFGRIKRMITSYQSTKLGTFD